MFKKVQLVAPGCSAKMFPGAAVDGQLSAPALPGLHALVFAPNGQTKTLTKDGFVLTLLLKALHKSA